MIKILGIKIDNIDKKIAKEKIANCLNTNKPCFITTPNPEIILKAQENEEFFYILNKANISLADGFGLKLSAKLMWKKIERYTGADLSTDLLNLAEKENKKVLIINWTKSLSTKNDIEKAIISKYPKLKFLILESERENTKNLDWSKINDFQAEILLVNFGAYYQERFIYLNKHKFNNLKIAVGIGGALDFLSGKIKRAPKIIRSLGIEWLWRLSLEPKKRCKRIFNAVFIFSYKIIKWKFFQPFKYRKNVVCLLYKKNEDSDKNKILIVERKDEKNHWQLPQGGTEGENLEKAAKREVEEELNLNSKHFITITTYKNLHKYNVYEWPKKINRKIKAMSGYKGQKQGLVIFKFLGNDEDIKINYFDHRNWQWINEDKLISKVHKHRKEATKIFLNKFKESKTN
ncbi:WecB/TagA/CpsF family glycosyltransferase [Patescibacteria group bacterium]|nr:WecB/TagA/CpsF family glycosyltransferase [Patescibacteria group bacterium]